MHLKTQLDDANGEKPIDSDGLFSSWQPLWLSLLASVLQGFDTLAHFRFVAALSASGRVIDLISV